MSRMDRLDWFLFAFHLVSVLWALLSPEPMSPLSAVVASTFSAWWTVKLFNELQRWRRRRRIARFMQTLGWKATAKDLDAAEDLLAIWESSAGKGWKRRPCDCAECIAKREGRA